MVAALLALVSFVAGIFSAITGGTSLVTVPVMILAGMNTTDAIATNMLVITSLSLGALARFRGAGVIPVRPTVGLALVSVPGSIVGAWLAIRMNDLMLRSIIAAALVAMMFLMAFEPKLTTAGRRSEGVRIAGYAVMAIVAVYGGMFSGGYATLLTFGCSTFFGLSLLESIAVAKVVNFMGSVAAVAVFAAGGRIQWGVGLAMSTTALAGGWVGAHFALRWGPQTVRRLLFVALTGLTTKMTYDAGRLWLEKVGRAADRG
jgi:hypothetical protein